MQKPAPTSRPFTDAQAAALLDAELAKAPRDMDTALVSRLLAQLEPSAPDNARQAQRWQRISRRFRLHQALHTVMRLSTAAAALLVLVLCLQQNALAFDWQFLRSIFIPAAATFQLTSSAQDVSPSAMQSAEEGPQLISWPTLESVPAELDGIPLKPDWLPAPLAYQCGAAYIDAHLTKTDLAFASGECLCTVSLTIYHTAGETLVDYEKELDDGVLRYINGLPVRICRNDGGRVLTAVWQMDNAAACVSGTLSEAELIRIVESLIR